MMIGDHVNAFFQSFRSSRIGRRLVVATIVFSSLITLSTTAYQLYADYHRDLKTIDGYFTLIGESYIGSLSRSVWLYDGRQIAAQLDGLLKLPDMDYLEIDAGEGYRWHAGSRRSTHIRTQEFPLHFRHRDQVFPIGMLRATASLDNIYDRLIGRALTLLVTNGIRAFFVSGFILVIFQFLVTRHLVELADRVKRIDLESRPDRIELERKQRGEHPDEIDQVVDALNETQQKLYLSYEALKISEDELSRIFSMSIDPISIADINTSTFLKVNPAFTEIFGFSAEALTAGPFLTFIHPDDVESTRKVVDEKLRAGRKVVDFENRFRCRNGTYRWLRWVFHPIPEKGISYSVAHDITAIKDSISRLEASHQRFLTVLDGIDAHIYVSDMASYEILFMNAKMKQDFGRDLTGETCWSVFRGETAPCAHCTNDRLVDAAGQPTDACNWQGQNPITDRWYMNYDRAIHWVDGSVVRLQIAVDITPLKVMEAELRQSHKMEAVGTLAGGIAHEFNNVLGIIVGNAELALDDVPEWNPARSNLTEIKTASLRAKDVVRQLLSFSRKSELQRRPVDVAPILSEAMQLLRASIPASIEIRSRVAAYSVPVLADPTQIQQVVINLCTNAAHAMEEGGGILDVSLERIQIDENASESALVPKPGRYVRMVVADTGEGIAPEIRDRVFDPFFTTKAVGKGTGMGLAIVHGIVTNHEGSITIESGTGGGTRVIVLLPVCSQEGSERREEANQAPQGNERILYVDDERPIVKMGGQMLERLGYSVTATTDPLQALERFREKPDAYDLVITDRTMPGISGDRLAVELLKIRPDLPVILCTGHSGNITPEAAREIGIRAFVPKPITKSELAKTVRNVLDMKRDAASPPGTCP